MNVNGPLEATKIEIITTTDGSHSLYLPSINESYHSVHGAINESQHVFVDQGLAYFNQQFKKSEIRVLEVGFGSGLNMLLSMLWSGRSNTSVVYTALEPYPLPLDIVKKLNYSHLIGGDKLQEVFDRSHIGSWQKEISLKPNFSLIKIPITLEAYQSKLAFDIVYFDAFAPNKQPEIWRKTNLAKLYRLLNANGFLVTYCAQGHFKRDLTRIGYKVETLAGPPGKFEMVRALKSN